MSNPVPRYQRIAVSLLLAFALITGVLAMSATPAWTTDEQVRKAAIVGLTRSAASEWGRFNIRTNAIAPTAMGATFHKLAAENPGFAEMSASMRPLGRCGEPEADIGPLEVVLASEMSRFITGETIHVDGGLHLPGYNSRPKGIPVREY